MDDAAEKSTELPGAPSNISAGRRTSERPGTPATATSEAPTLIREFRTEPKWLDRDHEKTGGSEAADWRKEFVKVIEEYTKDMTTTERTEFFEACITRNKDRYIQTFAAYYGMHPEHIPDRPGGVKSTKKERDGMVESPEVLEKQKKLFKTTWLRKNEEDPFCSKRAPLNEVTTGPRNESDPCAEPPNCQHCRKGEQKQKWLAPIKSIRKALSKKSQVQLGVTPATILQDDVTVSTAPLPRASIKDEDISGRSSLKELSTPRSRPPMWPPTEHAQHVEQQA